MPQTEGCEEIEQIIYSTSVRNLTYQDHFLEIIRDNMYSSAHGKVQSCECMQMVELTLCFVINVAYTSGISQGGGHELSTS